MATVITNTDIGANLGFSGSPLKLVANEQLRGNNYIVVYGKNNTPQQNSLELISKYNFAKTTMPNGQPLSSSNRFTILVAPGVYSFFSIIAPNLTLDTPYIDIISLSGEADVFLDTIFGNTPIIVNTSDIKLVGLNLSGQALAIEGNYTETYYKNIIGGDSCFSSQNPNVQISGNFENCRGTVGSFGNASNGGELMMANFKNCSGNFYSFGTKVYYSNFENCQASDFSFGTVEIYASNFLNCTSFGGNSFGSSSDINNESEIWGGTTFVNCKAGDYSFGVKNSDVKFTDCSAGVESFGANTANGNYKNCIAGINSFGSGLQGWSTLQAGGYFYNCVAEQNSFGANFANGEFYNCISTGTGGWIGSAQGGMGGFAMGCKGLSTGPGTAIYCTDINSNPINFGLPSTTNNI